MTVGENMMFNILEKELKKQRKWMSKEDKKKVVQEALHLFLDEDYSSEENSVKDVLASAEGVINSFGLKVSFDGDHLLIDYCDGSDLEMTKINCKDDILIALQEAVEAVMEPEEN